MSAATRPSPAMGRRIGRVLFSYMLLSLIGTSAGAETTMKWCSTWQARYVDAGNGEDALSTPDPEHYLEAPARYARCEIWDVDRDDRLWVGPLDWDGCTPDLPVRSHTHYRFRQGTVIERTGDRKIYLEPPGAPWGEHFIWVETDYRTYDLDDDAAYTHRFRPAWHTAQSNMGPIAAYILHYHGGLNLPEGMHTYIRSDEEACIGTSYVGVLRDIPEGSICIREDADGEDHTTWKYIVAHEIGHRQADATRGPEPGSYFHNGDLPDICACGHVPNPSGTNIRWHCLQSREYVGAAAAEGWAQFFATATYNSRFEEDCVFVYYKPVLLEDGTETGPPYVVDCTEFPQWMNTHCDPGDLDLGNEWDWLTFFWSLYTNPDGGMTVSMMSEIWAETSRTRLDYHTSLGETWDDLLETVGRQWGIGSDRHITFGITGHAAGVNHYAPDE